jgi:DNA-binding NtrC family response regulator
LSRSGIPADDLQEYLNKHRVDLLVLVSQNANPLESLNPVHALRRRHKNLPVIFLTSESSESLAIEAIRAGVNDYFKAPFNLNEICASVGRILQGLSPCRGETCSQRPHCTEEQMIGNSVFIQEIRSHIAQLAAAASNVLVTGETGTGKELVAQSIHRKSARAHKPSFASTAPPSPTS